MRTQWIGLIFLIAIACWIGCGTSEKPEFVEVPSGDPQPPAGDGEPIQDATDEDLQGCGEPAIGPALLPSQFPIEPENRLLKPNSGNLKVMPKSQRRVRPAPVGDVSLLLVPLAMAWLLRRRD